MANIHIAGTAWHMAQKARQARPDRAGQGQLARCRFGARARWIVAVHQARQKISAGQVRRRSAELCETRASSRVQQQKARASAHKPVKRGILCQKMRQIGLFNPVNPGHRSAPQPRHQPGQIKKPGRNHLLLRSLLHGHQVLKIGPKFIAQIGAGKAKGHGRLQETRF